MATIFDTSLLQPFDVLFSAILVFSVVFALLRKTNATKTEGVSIDAIISVAASFLVIISDVAIEIINFMTPWFVVVFLFLMMLLLVYQIFGVGEGDIKKYLLNDKGLGWLLFAVGLLIFFAALSNSLGQQFLEAGEGGTSSQAVVGEGGGVATGDFQTNIITTLRHPKILGIGMVLVVMVFAVALLTGPAKP